MKIVYVSPRYPPGIGGIRYVVKSIAERLVERRHEVYVLCGDSKIGYPVEEIINGVKVIRWPVLGPGGAYHIPKAREKLVERFLELAKDSDVVHIHGVHQVFPVYLMKIVKDLKNHVVLTPHYHGTGHTFFRKVLWWFWRRHVKKAMRYVHVVHAVSEYEKRLVKRDFGTEPVVIEHGVEEWLPEVQWSPSGYVLYSGRIEKYKNVHRLANIVKHLREFGKDLELKVIGNGSYTHRLIRHLRRLKIPYELKPPQPYRDYVNYLSKANLLGLLSEKEAFGQIVNEANAIGVPAVVAEPWGITFSSRSRVLITRLDMPDYEIAKKIAEFIEKAKNQPKPSVLTWSQVVDLYIKHLY